MNDWGNVLVAAGRKEDPPESEPLAGYWGASLFETDVGKRKAELVHLYILCATAAAHGTSSHSLTV